MSSLALSYVVNLLARREYSEFELRNKMQKKAFNMIGRISQDFQIIYLSCHEYAVL